MYCFLNEIKNTRYATKTMLIINLKKKKQNTTILYGIHPYVTLNTMTDGAVSHILNTV